MGKKSKLYRAQLEKIDRGVQMTLADAVALLKELPQPKFDQTVEMAFRLGVDPKQTDQTVRGALPLPKGTGKSVKVCVITDNVDAQKEATGAGADFVGFEDIIEKIKGGWVDFDVLIASPSAMPKVRPLGRQLGPKGLMPNPKSGTVTMDVAKAITDIKAGKVEYRVDKTNICHCPVGKVSFGKEKIGENLNTLMDAIIKAKPAAAKGTYIKSLVLSTTMGPGVKFNGMKF